MFRGAQTHAKGNWDAQFLGLSLSNDSMWSFMLSTRGSYGSEMPPQIHKHSLMHLIVGKIGISMKSVTCES